jgi:hypothetical protein
VTPIEFRHRQAAHCENGATANLLGFHGLAVSEPMAFGIGSGLFFAYLPFITLNGAPGFTYRSLPGTIFSKAAARLGVTVERHRFGNPERAMDALDRLLDGGTPVGCVVGVFHLPYFPPAYRFHFNAHNLVVFGRRGDDYLVSDPIMEEPQVISREDLARVRFARGLFAPRGHMYHVGSIRREPDLADAIRTGIRQTCRWMLQPVPILGVRGIRFLAGRIPRWPLKVGSTRAAVWLGQVIRMQEEIGTGGGGFRFIQAAFLQEAAGVLGDARLEEASRDMTDIGDRWRGFALAASRIYKDRDDGARNYAGLGNQLADIAGREEALFRRLLAITR